MRAKELLVFDEPAIYSYQSRRRKMKRAGKEPSAETSTLTRSARTPTSSNARTISVLLPPALSLASQYDFFVVGSGVSKVPFSKAVFGM
jgi:hypothetical protein